MGWWEGRREGGKKEGKREGGPEWEVGGLAREGFGDDGLGGREVREKVKLSTDRAGSTQRLESALAQRLREAAAHRGDSIAEQRSQAPLQRSRGQGLYQSPARSDQIAGGRESAGEVTIAAERAEPAGLAEERSDKWRRERIERAGEEREERSDRGDRDGAEVCGRVDERNGVDEGGVAKRDAQCDDASRRLSHQQHLPPSLPPRPLLLPSPLQLFGEEGGDRVDDGIEAAAVRGRETERADTEDR